MSPNSIQAGVPDPRKPQPADTVHVSTPQTTPKAEKTTAPAVVAATETAQTPAPAATAAKGVEGMQLPVSMVSRTDVSRTLREIEGLNDYFRQAAIRGSKEQGMPASSRVLDSFASENGLNLLHAPDRDKAREFLDKVKARGPVVHLSFAAEPGGDFMAQLLAWFRREAHPFVMLHVGLQPELAAGCMIRTTNKVFDFSFRARFEASKSKLTDAIMALGAKTDTAAPAEPEAAQPQSAEQPAAAVPAQGAPA